MKNLELSRINKAVIKVDERYNPGEIEDIDIFMQTWGSTALGFPGAGGDMITSAPSVVIYRPDHKVDVFFGSRFAYQVPVSKTLISDIHKHKLAAVSEYGKYLNPGN